MDSNLFNNPAFASLSPEKLQFLLSFAQKEKPLNMKDAMPFLLSNMSLTSSSSDAGGISTFFLGCFGRVASAVTES